MYNPFEEECEYEDDRNTERYRREIELLNDKISILEDNMMLKGVEMKRLYNDIYVKDQQIKELDDVIRTNNSSITSLNSKIDQLNSTVKQLKIDCLKYSDKIALLESLCKSLYLNVDPLISSSMTVDSSLRYLFNTVHEDTIQYEDGRYVGDTMEGKRHGRGRCTYDNGDVYIGTYMNDSRHGKTHIIYNGRFGIQYSQYEYRHGGLHGYQVDRFWDGSTTHNIYDNDTMVYVQKEEREGYVIYTNIGGSIGQHVYKIEVDMDSDTISTWRKRGDSQCTVYKAKPDMKGRVSFPNR